MPFLLFTLNCFAQTETKEDFLNEVDMAIVQFKSENEQMYFLSKEAGTVFAGTFSWCRHLVEFKRVVDSSTINEMVSQANIDTEEVEWNFNNLARATPFYGQIKKITERDTIWESHYYFSRPIFDRSKNYVMISVGHWCGLLCGYQEVLLFKKMNKHWIKISEAYGLVN